MSLRWAISDALVLTRRSLTRITRSLDWIVYLVIQPVMFVLLFVYVFGGAIQTGYDDYVDYLMPGIFVQSIAFGSVLTTLGLADDLNRGLIDRLRSLPMARSAVLAGRTTADIITNSISIAVMLVVGLLVGFSFATGLGDVLLAFALLVLFGYSMSWIGALIGMVAPTVETAQSAGTIWLFPLTFASSVFVPPDRMPDWLQAFAEVNPITQVADAMRALMLGAPAGDSIWLTAIWSVGIVAVFAPVAVWRFRGAVTR